MDLDSFFVSVERLLHPELEGRPIMIGGSSRRGVVAACSYETRQFGVHSAMPMRLAKSLCPDALIIKGDMEQYSKHSKLVTEVIAEQAPVYEKSSIDEFYLDISGMDRYFGCYKWAGELRQKITHETGLPISFGLSVNKTVSKVGTNEAKPNGQIEIPRGQEKSFLAPMSVSKIPMIGEKTFRHLSEMGVRTVKTLSEIPVTLLEREFGKHGHVLWKKANGIDNTPVVPYSERKSISTERTFEQDTTDIKRLKSILISMTEKLAYQLRQEEKLTSCVTVKIRYTDFQTVSKQIRIPYTTRDDLLITQVHELFDKLYDRRVLIRLIGIRFSDFVRGNYQIHLFDDTTHMIQLFQALDRMQLRYGAGTVRRAGGQR
jgi:DNA polymerase-4